MITILIIALAIWYLTGCLQDMYKHSKEFDQAVQEENKSTNDVHLNQYNYAGEEFSENHHTVKQIKNLGE